MLQKARRAREAAARVAKMDALKAQGLTAKEALRELDDPRLNMIDDPARKIRRDRKKVRGKR